MEEIDDPTDWLALPSKAMGGALASFEANLRCPICAELLQAAMTAKCGHAFCSKCVREWLGRSNETKNCPSCRANRGANKETRVAVEELRPCPLLDKAATEFKAIRAQLLTMLSTPPAPPSPAASAAGGARGAGKGKRVRKPKKFADEEEEERNSAAAAAAAAASAASSSSDARRAALPPAQQQAQDRYWEQEEFLKAVKKVPSYHLVKDAQLRPMLSAVGLGTADGKESLPWKHKTFLRLAFAERDNVRCGKPSRPLRAVVREVEELYCVHHRGQGGGKGRGQVSAERAVNSAASQAAFKAMVKQMRAKQKAQKEQVAAGQEEEAKPAAPSAVEHEAQEVEREAAAPCEAAGWEECEKQEEMEGPPPPKQQQQQQQQQQQEEEEMVEIVGSVSASASVGSSTRGPWASSSSSKRVSTAGSSNSSGSGGKRARTQSLLGQGQASSWGCPACTYTNAPGAAKCVICATARSPASSGSSVGRGGEGGRRPTLGASQSKETMVVVEEIIVEDSHDGCPASAQGEGGGDGNGNAVPPFAGIGEGAGSAGAAATAVAEAGSPEKKAVGAGAPRLFPLSGSDHPAPPPLPVPYSSLPPPVQYPPASPSY